MAPYKKEPAALRHTKPVVGSMKDSATKTMDIKKGALYKLSGFDNPQFNNVILQRTGTDTDGAKFEPDIWRMAT